jgi:hypothetical protein
MKIRSIPHIWFILAGLIIIPGPFYLTFGVLSKLYQTGETIPREGYFPLGIFSTLGFWALLSGIYLVKIIIISNDRIKIIFPLRLKQYSYKLSEIVKCYRYKNPGKFKNYESFHFQTNDDNIFMISDFEYWNYKKIKSIIESNSKIDLISKYHNIRVVLILLMISVLLTIGLITIFNISI